MTLVIMAAGLGSRYKGGIKQMDAIGPSGEWFMDYAIYDAYQAGIRKVVLIIREELENLLQEHFSNRLPEDLELVLVQQNVKDIPVPFPFERTKPWGTGHAILCCKNVIQEPFIVINSDDYYGQSVFSKLYTFLEKGTQNYCMAGYFLKNTLSEHGTVNRGICKINQDSHLICIEEMYKIQLCENGIYGKRKDGTSLALNEDSYCSLNLWGFLPSVFETLDIQFEEFLSHLENVEEDEFLLPTIIQNMIQENKAVVEVLPTNEEWFGMTYQEDKDFVKRKIETYIEEGKYPMSIWKK